jgi:hypothetical protein
MQRVPQFRGHRKIRLHGIARKNVKRGNVANHVFPLSSGIFYVGRAITALQYTLSTVNSTDNVAAFMRRRKGAVSRAGAAEVEQAQALQKHEVTKTTTSELPMQRGNVVPTFYHRWGEERICPHFAKQQSSPMSPKLRHTLYLDQATGRWQQQGWDL